MRNCYQHNVVWRKSHSNGCSFEWLFINSQIKGEQLFLEQKEIINAWISSDSGRRNCWLDFQWDYDVFSWKTKTSLSEHGIEIYNTGKNPFILESFELCYKNKLLVDCHIVENAKVLMPSESFTYTLMEQEADALQHHCNQEKFETCDVTAYSVEGKKIKTKLWVPLFYIRAGR